MHNDKWKIVNDNSIFAAIKIVIMKKLYTLLFLMVSLATMAQNNFTPEKMWDLERIGSPAVSPNGELLLFTARSYDVKENKGSTRLFVLTLSKNELKSFKNLPEDPSQVAWRPDGKKITYLSSKENETQLWEFDIEKDENKRVTNIEGGITWYKYSPDLKHIAFGQDVKLDKTVSELYPDLDKVDARIIDGLMYRHWTQWSDYKYAHVFVAPYQEQNLINTGKDIMKDEKYHSPLRPFGGDEQITFSANGKLLLYTCKKLEGTKSAYSTNSDIYVYDIEKQSTNTLKGCGVGYDVEAKVYGEKEGRVAWLSMERAGYEADKNRIMVANIYPATSAPNDITKDFKYSVDGFAWGPEGEKIFFLSTINATRQIFEYDFKSNKITQITQGVHDYNTVIPYKTGKKTMLVGMKNSMSHPAALYTVDLKGNETALKDLNTEKLSKIQMGEVRKRMVKTTDGKDMLTWVIYPPNFDSTKKYPTLLYCQGGPQSPVSQFFSYRWNFQLMAGQGYIVVAPNRRGLPGFGQEWNDAIMGDYGGQPMDDYLSAIDDVAKESYVDNDRMGAVGASFGGYSVYWLAGHHNKRFKCFISHCGMFNMESWYGTTEEMFFAKNDNGHYWANTENYDKNSPHNYVKNWDAPMLVIHNEKDFRVPLGQGMEAFTAAQSLGVPSRFLYFPDEGHWVNKPQNSLLWNRVFFDWLDKWLKK